MARIAITDGLADDAIGILLDAGHEVLQVDFEVSELEDGILGGFDAVIVRSATKLTAKVIAESANGMLRVIGRAGVGVDNIDLDAATLAKIMVLNAPSSSTNSVAEMTIAHLLAAVKYIPQADRSLRSGEWAKSRFVGSELSGKNLGLIGYGRIARAVAEIARAFGMNIHAYDPFLSGVEFGDSVSHHDALESLFSVCTHISVHCNLSSDTYHLVTQDLLNLMPSFSPDGKNCGNHLINCARGGIVDENAVLSSLEDGQLQSASLDVFESEPVDCEHPLLFHESFHGSPHVSASTIEAQSRVGMEIVDMVMNALDGLIPTNLVNKDVLEDG